MVFLNWKSKYFSGELKFQKLESVCQEITKNFRKNKIFLFYMRFDAMKKRNHLFMKINDQPYSTQEFFEPKKLGSD